jgi:hypothetical protein
MTGVLLHCVGLPRVVEHEREWFGVLMAVELSLGTSPAYQVRMMLSSGHVGCAIERRPMK